MGELDSANRKYTKSQTANSQYELYLSSQQELLNTHQQTIQDLETRLQKSTLDHI